MSKKIDSKELIIRLQGRYREPEWIFLTEVRSQTGFQGEASIRYADGFAFGMFPSRGLEILGFEIKTSRSDWLTELKNHDKAEQFYEKCDKWYLVVSDKNIVQNGELPKGWGLIAPYGNGLRTYVEAEAKDSGTIDRNFFAVLLRKIKGEAILDTELERCRRDSWNRGYSRGREESEHDLSGYKSLKSAVEQFENETGLKINEYNIDDSIQIIRLAEEMKYNHIGYNFDWAIRETTAALKTLKEVQESYKAAFKKGNE